MDAGPVPVTVTYAVIGLTNFGERPVLSARLAEVLGRPVSEAEALARRWGWPGTRVEDGLITVNPERARSATRRHVQIGERRFGVTGCAGDIFYYAPLVRPSLHLRDYARTDPDWVRSFADTHDLSPLSRREALKHLS